VDEKPPLRTVIVEGPLALAMRRFEAAGAGEIGLQILNLPQLAARLSGGFHQPAAPEVLEPAIQGALNEKGFREIERVIELPGITRAVARTLQKVWNADIDLEATAAKGGAPRLRDLAVIESRVRAQLPTATLLPRDLRAAALARIDHAPALLGPLRIENISWVPPLWRKLLNALHGIIPVEWITPTVAEKSWFSGVVKSIDLTNDIEQCDVISCADPHHEVVESLRWVRRLLSTNTAKSREIAIAAAAPAMWDEYFLGLAADAGLRIHFTHGITALSTRDGQRCAALADVLVRGLSEQRVRRLLALSAGERTEFDRLPPAWLRALPRGASLLTLGDWDACSGECKRAGGRLIPKRFFCRCSASLLKDPRRLVKRARFYCAGDHRPFGRQLCARRRHTRLSSRCKTFASRTKAIRQTPWCGDRPRISPRRRESGSGFLGSQAVDGRDAAWKTRSYRIISSPQRNSTPTRSRKLIGAAFRSSSAAPAEDSRYRAVGAVRKETG
jgi:hypothetical protein